MAVLKCKMCGGDLAVEPEMTVCECEYCGTKQTVPNTDDEKKLKLYERANRLRFRSEFDKAAGVYESLIEEYPEEAEAYWGNLLCKYGIEYVDDPATGDKVPTCHRSSFDSFMDDPDFDMVMENADTVSRKVYREQAKQIEEIRKGIIEVSGKEQPYDIFICYKETDDDGERTLDSVLAQDVYEALSEKGYRVFFSRISLEDKLGTEYEPYIFAALNSAKIMLAFGTSYDYYNAVWVKNEWSRFLKLMAKDKKKYLIPCYKDIDAYDMPKEFARLQAQDMGKVGAIQDLLRGIDKIIGSKQADAQVLNVHAVSVQQPGSGENALLRRGELALEDGEWETAYKFYDQVLNNDPESAQAYLGQALSNSHARDISEFVKRRLEKYNEVEKTQHILQPDPQFMEKLRQTIIDNDLEYEVIINGIKYYTLSESRKKQYEAEQRYLEKDRFFSKAVRFSSDEGRAILEEFKTKIMDGLSALAHEAELTDKKTLAEAQIKLVKKCKDESDKIEEKCRIKADEYEALCADYASVNPVHPRKWHMLKFQLYGAYKDAKEKSEEAKNSINELRKELVQQTDDISSLNYELSKLGMFSGKRREEINHRIQEARSRIKYLERILDTSDECKALEEEVIKKYDPVQKALRNAKPESVKELYDALSQLESAADMIRYLKSVNLDIPEDLVNGLIGKLKWRDRMEAGYGIHKASNIAVLKKSLLGE